MPSIIERAEKSKAKEIVAPHFPLLKDITFEKWESIFKTILNKIDKNTIIIAHSLSTLFIVKMALKYKLSFKALICVAGGFIKEPPEDFKYL